MAGFLAGFGQGLLDYSNQLNNNAYRQALLQLNQQNQQLRARQVLAELSERQRQQQAQAAMWQAYSKAAAQPSGVSLDMTSSPSGQWSLPEVPDATGQMAAPSSLKSQVLGLEGNRDVRGAAGEIGPGQIMPATGAQYGYSPDQLWGDSGRAASGRIVDDLYRRSGGDAAATLVGYNRGPGAMQRFQAAGDNLSALKSPLAPAYAKAVEADLSPEAQQQGGQVAVRAAGMLPPQMVGRAGPDVFARMLQNLAGTDAPDDVKGAALMHLLPLMSQEGQRSFQQAWEVFKFGEQQAQHQEDVQERRQDRAATREQTRELAEERMDISRQSLDLRKQTAAKQSEAAIDDNTAKEMAEQYLAGDRTIMQNLGRGAQGAANIVKLRGEIAKQLAEKGVSGTEMATRIAEFEGLKAGERTLGTRTAQMGLAVNELEAMLPVALEASDKVDRTQYPNLNSLLLAGERGTGDENVVRLSAATNSLLNVYARAVTPSGQPTEGAQKRAREVLDQAYSQGQYRAAVDQMLKEVRAAQQSPGATRQEFRRQTDPGSSLGAPATGTELGGVPVPAEFANAPDGKKFQGSDGKVYVKSGNQMVPQ